MSIPAPSLPLLTVSQLNGIIAELLESALPVVWVSGEVSNFVRHRSGHCYFTLKDDSAQLKAILWRSVAGRMRCDVHDGLEVICRGRIEVYAERGQYQVSVEHLEPKGLGALEQALRKLRAKLEAEGLFAPQRKRPLPRFPRRVAFVTSPTGAAVRDFLEVLRRRWCGVDVLIVPVRVQGIGAAAEIAAAIARVNELTLPVDVLVVGRGGGSLEDLWAFNEEPVVRAIHASRIPVISAVGHEIDVTLADLVADVRALTPSEAAERIAPSSEELRADLFNRHAVLRGAWQRRAVHARGTLERLAQHRTLRRPFDLVHALGRQLDQLQLRSDRAIDGLLRHARQHAGALSGKLETLSPLGVLARGYSLTQRAADGRLVHEATELAAGEQIVTRFAHGQIVSRVESIEAAQAGPSSSGGSS